MNREEIEGAMLDIIRDNLECRRIIREAEESKKTLAKNEERLRELFYRLEY